MMKVSVISGKRCRRKATRFTKADWLAFRRTELAPKVAERAVQAVAELRPLRCGIPGKRRCKNPPLAFFNEHHYVRLDVLPGALQLCPRRLDGSPLEECLTLRLPPRS